MVPLNASNVLGAEDRRPILKWESHIRSTLNKSHQLRSIYKSYSAPPSPPLSPSSSNNIETSAKIESRWNLNDLLDWPEHSLEKPVQPTVTGTKLRRVSTSVNLSLKGGLKRVYHSSGNLGMLWSEHEETVDVLNSIDDLSDKVSDEGTNVVEKTDKGGSGRKAKRSRSKFVRIVSKQMVGIYISVWVCRRLRRHVNNLEVAPVGVGLMGYMGNKVAF